MPERDIYSDDYQEFQRYISYSFKDQSLLRQAFTHKSYKSENQCPWGDNEILEFLGDAVLDLCISHLLFEKSGHNITEGQYTKTRAFLVNKNQLSALSKDIGLNKYILLGIGEIKQNGSEKKSILANVFEAVLGAIYLDGGLKAARTFVDLCYVDVLMDMSFSESLKDYKSSLQEFTQKNYNQRPVYPLLDSYGPDHDKRFIIGVEFQGKIIAESTGKSKKDAEQNAAKKALEYLTEGEEIV
jgi:ribonuclease III